MVLEALGALTAIGSTVAGTIASNQKNKQAREDLNRQRQENQQWWNVKKSQNGLNQAYNQAILSRFEKQTADKLKEINATNAVAGGTNERFAVAQEAEGNAKQNLLADMSANEARLKEQEEQIYRRVDAGLAQAQINNTAQEGQNAAVAASAGLTAGMNLIGAAYPKTPKDKQSE